MKTFKITIVTTCTDEFFENEAKEIQQDIFSGKFQREMTIKEDGVMKVKASFQVYKKPE